MEFVLLERKDIFMKNDQILKPMSIIRNEFINNLTDLINNSMLPPFVIEDVLKDTYNKISVISKQQLEDDMKKYRDAISKAASQAK